MAILQNLFRKSSEPNKKAKDKDLIKVYDEFGRELLITREEWKDKVLIGNLELNKSSPEELYSIILNALQDGFAKECLPYAEHLARIDTDKHRSSNILGIIYLELNLLDKAENTLLSYLKDYGEDGIIYTNLAKVYSNRGLDDLSDKTLLHGLELDPNQDNGLLWYAALQKEKHGEEAEKEAFRKIAQFPKSWRANLWIARDLLQQHDITSALTLYQKSLTIAGNPIPPDLLMQLSGDLGNNGYLHEIIECISPVFDPKYHGLQVGNNLIKAYVDTEKYAEAKNLVAELYKANRHDWKSTLSFWDTEIAKKEVEKQSNQQSSIPEVELYSFESPLWLHDDSFCKDLKVKKIDNQKKVVIIGGCVVKPKELAKQEIQLADTSGRLSRAIPLFLSELLSMNTDCDSIAILPFAKNVGFAVLGSAYTISELKMLTENKPDKPDIAIAVSIICMTDVWSVSITILDIKTDQFIEQKYSINLEKNDLGLTPMIQGFLKCFDTSMGIRYSSKYKWYDIDKKDHLADYLLRTEQLITIYLQGSDSLNKAMLYGIREMLDGSIQLCIASESNLSYRMLYFYMLQRLKTVDPDIFVEYKDKTIKLNQQYCIPEYKILCDTYVSSLYGE